MSHYIPKTSPLSWCLETCNCWDTGNDYNGKSTKHSYFLINWPLLRKHHTYANFAKVCPFIIIQVLNQFDFIVIPKGLTKFPPWTWITVDGLPPPTLPDTWRYYALQGRERLDSNLDWLNPSPSACLCHRRRKYPETDSWTLLWNLKLCLFFLKAILLCWVRLLSI